MRHRSDGIAVALTAAIVGALALAGCRAGADEAEALPTRTPSRVIAQAAATATPEPTAAAQATEAAAATLAAAPEALETVTDTAAAETLLPQDPNAVFVQLGRIEPSPWEPQVLGQMRPHLSLQAGGLGVFSAPYGDSESGWYQTIITPTEGLAFLKILMDDIDVLDLATRHGIPQAEYAVNPDGSPAGSGVVGVIYVRSQGREGRLVIPEKVMESPPPGPDYDRLKQLHSVVLAVEVWKQGLFRDFTPEEKLAVGSVMGWWSDVRLPFTPASAVMYGTRARANIPGDPASVPWPLTAPTLAEAFDAPYGSKPSELLLRGDDLSMVLAADRQRPASFWGPLWSQEGSDMALAGIRVGVPGGNYCVIDYTYQVPRRGLRPPAPTPEP